MWQGVTITPFPIELVVWQGNNNHWFVYLGQGGGGGGGEERREGVHVPMAPRPIQQWVQLLHLSAFSTPLHVAHAICLSTRCPHSEIDNIPSLTCHL